MNFQEKEALRVQSAEKLGKASGVILAEYRGLSAGEIAQLRVELRKVDAQAEVIKNRIVRKAVEKDKPEYGSLSELLKGPLCTIFAYGDAAAACKTVLDFEKDHPSFKVAGGVVDSSAVGPAELKALADLPSKDVLLGQIVGSLVAPHRGLMGVMNGVSRQLVQVINAIKDTKSE